MDFLWFLFVLVALNALVSLGVAAFVRSKTLCICASVAITELLAALYILIRGADSPFPDMVLLAVNCIAIFGTPVLVGSSIGFIAMAGSLHRRRVAASKYDQG